jgi:autotransporter strand-loop-strand O-heptosyltransferase
MKEILNKEYPLTAKLFIPSKSPQNRHIFHFINGPFFEIKGNKKVQYDVKFINPLTNSVVYQTPISNNMWAACSPQYYIPWRISITGEDYNLDYDLDLSNKRVYIHLDSEAIGDTLAWFPYVEEFRKKHNCILICSTFHNEWFEKEYPEIEFIKPGSVVNHIYAQYNIGWYYTDNDQIDYSKVPTDFRKGYLGLVASSILGLDPIEVKPQITTPNLPPSIPGKYVCISPHASAHAKYWLHENGWQEVIKYLNQNGYKVVLISKEPLNDAWHDSKLNSTMKGVINKSGEKYPLEDRINDIKHAAAFIGVGSGLAWLSWAVNTPVVMISGFSSPESEFTTGVERVFNPSVCNSCYNQVRLDAGDWDWCPFHKGTERQFECSKSITPNMVIKALNKTLNIYNHK